MKILAVETSCDETAAAVVEDNKILSSIKYTQEIHKEWGGVVPSLAKRAHEERIDGIIEQAIKEAGVKIADVEAIAVTVGPGLAIALEVGIKKARELALKYDKPLIAVNHVEGHMLSSLVNNPEVNFPAAALVVSGGHTQVLLIQEIGKYKILAESLDDDIGEALDKGARALGLGWPGGAELEKRASLGNAKRYPLPLPMAGKETNKFSYSGLKTALVRLINQSGELSEEQRNDLAASFQETVFKHLVRITEKVLAEVDVQDLLVGGGVIANSTLREKLEEMAERLNVKIHMPGDMVLCTDNAAMIGVAAGFKAKRGEFVKDEAELDRKPRWRVGI